MKVACLVMAYRGAAVLRRMASLYVAAGWDLFVHLDRKVDRSAYLCALGDARPLCRFVEDPVEVFWGGFSMVRAELKLIETAKQAGSYDRYLLISDDTIPIDPAPVLRERHNNDIDFIELNKQPEGSEYYRRYTGFFFFDHPATAVRRPGYRLLAELDDRFFQEVTEIAALRQRGKKVLDVYWGSQFWSLTAGTVEFVLAAIAEDEYMVRSFEFSAISDELLFQSVIGNNQAGRSIAGGPVYADWHFEPGPRIYSNLEELSYDFMPHHTFLRKVDPAARQFLDTVAARLQAGQGFYPLRPDADTSDSLVVDTADGTLAILTMPAPEPGETPPGWQAVEGGDQIRFRWTAAQTIEWPPIERLPPSRRVRIVVPLLVAIAPDFADACQISLAGQTKPVSRRGRYLYADFEPGDAPDLKVVLSTPKPISPSQLTGSPDRRPLGLAIRLTDTG